MPEEEVGESFGELGEQLLLTGWTRNATHIASIHSFNREYLG